MDSTLLVKIEKYSMWIVKEIPICFLRVMNIQWTVCHKLSLKNLSVAHGMVQLLYGIQLQVNHLLSWRDMLMLSQYLPYLMGSSLLDHRIKLYDCGLSILYKKKLKMLTRISSGKFVQFLALVLHPVQMMKQSNCGQLMEIYFTLLEVIWDSYLL